MPQISVFMLVLVYQNVYYNSEVQYQPAVKWQTERQDQTSFGLLESAASLLDTLLYML